MSTCHVLIKRALRMLGELNSGREPPANEAADALEALKGLYKHLIATGRLGRLTDVLIDADYTAGENQRLINTATGSITVTLPDTINEGSDAFDGAHDYGFSTTDRAGRPPRDRSVVVVAGNNPQFYVYDADLASWVRIDAIVLTDEAPFSQKLETGIAALLALHVASEYRDSDPPAVVQRGAAECLSALSGRPDRRDIVTQAEYF